MAGYVPRKGDLIMASFDPQAGHEQRGRRPALVISNDVFQKRTGMAIVCPLTNTDRGYRLHIPVPEISPLTGFVMVEQVKSIDYSSRRAEYVAAAPRQLLQEVLAVLDACMY